MTLDYDKRRNVIADATREFRYNYRNQLRRVIRKSDDADISKYREDAYGRRVQAVIEWELGRRVYFDTRFELDVDMDDDNDATDLKYVDGGITSDDAPGPGQADQIAAWPSRLDEPITNGRHYFDFHVDIPDVSGSSSNYLGFVAYENYEVRIYGNRYELWTTGGGSAIASYTAPGSDTKGRHNIGIGAPGNVWIDGTNAMTGAAIKLSPEARFGTQDSSSGNSVDGLVLLECLTYHKPPLRTDDNEPLGATGARVTHHFFDGPQVVTTEEVYDPTLPDTGTSVSSHSYIEAVSPTIQDTIDENDNRSPRMMLSNGRLTTGQVIERNADSFVNSEGTIIGHPGGETLPGVSHTITTDANGTPRTHGRTSASTDPTPGTYLTTNNPQDGAYIYHQISMGGLGLPWSDMSLPLVTMNYSSETGMLHHNNDGEQWDRPTEVSTSPNPDRETSSDWGAGKELEDWLDDNEGNPAVSDRESKTPDRLRRWQKILREAQFDPYLARLLWRVEITMTARGISAIPYDPPKKNPNRETRSSWAEPGEVDSKGREYESKLREAINRVNAEDPEQSNLRYRRRSRSWVSWMDPCRRWGEMWNGLKEDSVWRVRDLENGNLIRAWLGRQRFDRIMDRSTQQDMNGDELGVLGAALAEPGESLGIKDIGDSIEMLDDAESAEDYQDALDTLGTGIVKFGSAIVTVYGGAQAIKALSTGLCFVGGTLVLRLADGANPEEARRAVERGDDAAGWCECVAIEKIKVGDWVLTRQDGEPEAPLTFRQVEETFVNTVEELVGLTTIGTHSDSASTVWTTVGHPFWTTWTGGALAPVADPSSPRARQMLSYRTDTNGEILRDSSGWVFATDLKRGYVLATSSTQDALLLNSEHKSVRSTTVYNFSVHETHTYFITGVKANITPTLGLWVHNRNAGRFPGLKGKKLVDRVAKDLRRLGYQVETRVEPIKTPFGKRIPDIAVYKDGRLVGYVECKNGRYARYSTAQRAKDTYISEVLGQPTAVIHEK